MSHQPDVLRTLTLAALVAAGSTALAQSPPLRLIAASNVTVRQTPSVQAPAVTQLPLGTEVAEAGDADLDKTWVHVVTPDGKDGWVLARLTRRLDPFWKWQTQEQVITERLARRGDGFAARVELLEFIERVADSFSDPETRARMDLYRLQALQQVLSAVPSSHATREPYTSWFARYQTWTAPHEPAAAWRLTNDAIWKVHDSREGTTAADEIAWLAVTAGVGGECEGHLPCYVEWRNRLQGEYLRRHPAGAHVPEAVSGIAQTAARFDASPARYTFEPEQDCAPLTASLDALTSAIRSASAAPDREAALAALADIRERCR